MRLKFTILLVFNFGLMPVFGQQPGATRYFNLAPGATFSNAQDLGMSPMIYKGIGSQLELSVHKTKKAAFQSWELILEYGALKPKFTSRKADRLNAQINYTVLWEFLKDTTDRFDFRLGGSWLSQCPTLVHRGYSNNNFNFTFMSSLGLVGYVEMPIQLLKREWTLHGTFHLPLFALTERPSFAYAAPEGYFDYEEGKEVRDFIESLELQTLNKFVRLRTRIGLAYPLFNGNRLEVGYNWDFYSVSTIKENRVSGGTHGLYFMTQFNF